MLSRDPLLRCRYGAHLSKEQVAELVAPHPETLELVNSWLELHDTRLQHTDGLVESALGEPATTLSSRDAITSRRRSCAGCMTVRLNSCCDEPEISGVFRGISEPGGPSFTVVLPF